MEGNDKHLQQLKTYSEISLLSEQLAILVIFGIGTNVLGFKDAKHLYYWNSIVPENNESAGEKKSVHISCVGIYLKTVFIQRDNDVIKDKSCPNFRHRYESIKKRHERVIITIIRMFLNCIYNVLLKNEVFDNSIYEEYLKKEHFCK